MRPEKRREASLAMLGRDGGCCVEAEVVIDVWKMARKSMRMGMPESRPLLRTVVAVAKMRPERSVSRQASGVECSKERRAMMYMSRPRKLRNANKASVFGEERMMPAGERM